MSIISGSLGNSRGGSPPLAQAPPVPNPSSALGYANAVQSPFAADPSGGLPADAAIQAAINSLPQTGNETTSGGIVYLPPGTYLLTNPLVLDGLFNITLKGAGGRYGATRLLVGHLGTGISMKGASSPILEGIAVVNTNAAYTGKMIDASGASGGPTTNFPTLRDVRLSMVNQANSQVIGVDVNFTITAKLEDCYLTGGGVGVYGCRLATDFCNAAQLERVYFQGQFTANIRNLGATSAGVAEVANCVFEPLQGGGAGAYLQDAGVVFQGLLKWSTNWVGDGNGTGSWITFNGWALTVQSEFEDAANAILLNGEVRALAVGGFLHQNAARGGINLNGQIVRSFKDLGLYVSNTPAVSGTSSAYGAGGGGSLGTAAPAVQVLLTAAQAIASPGVNTLMTWAALDYDTLNNLGLQWVPGSPTQLLCVIPGLYRISATIVWAANNTGDRVVSFKQGGSFIGGSRIAPNILGTATTNQQASVTKLLNAGDLITCWVMQNTAGSLNIQVTDGGTNTPTAFSMERIG